MVYIIWIASLGVAFYLGYHFRTIDRKIEILEQEVKKKIDKPVEKPESTLIDPLDPVKEAIYQAEQFNKKLNNE